jgi:hypothetical protein
LYAIEIYIYPLHVTENSPFSFVATLLDFSISYMPCILVSLTVIAVAKNDQTPLAQFICPVPALR